MKNLNIILAAVTLFPALVWADADTNEEKDTIYLMTASSVVDRGAKRISASCYFEADKYWNHPAFESQIGETNFRVRLRDGLGGNVRLRIMNQDLDYSDVLIDTPMPVSITLGDNSRWLDEKTAVFSSVIVNDESDSYYKELLSKSPKCGKNGLKKLK